MMCNKAYLCRCETGETGSLTGLAVLPEDGLVGEAAFSGGAKFSWRF